MRVVRNENILSSKDIFPQFDTVHRRNMRPVTDRSTVADSDCRIEPLIAETVPGGKLDLFADCNVIAQENIPLACYQRDWRIDPASLSERGETVTDDSVVDLPAECTESFSPFHDSTKVQKLGIIFVSLQH